MASPKIVVMVKDAQGADQKREVVIEPNTVLYFDAQGLPKVASGIQISSTGDITLTNNASIYIGDRRIQIVEQQDGEGTTVYNLQVT